MFNEKLVTVWSAPNYCYRCGNLASILTIRDEADGGREFKVYDAAPENARDRAGPPGRGLLPGMGLGGGAIRGVSIDCLALCACASMLICVSRAGQSNALLRLIIIIERYF